MVEDIFHGDRNVKQRDSWSTEELNQIAHDWMVSKVMDLHTNQTTGEIRSNCEASSRISSEEQRDEVETQEN